ncbi:hypothetical protein D8674_039665 [Pyrus ussuriensis x Pyrus communis]|uniref:Ubiquitin-like protease family profile domain-containing protein n=1 Tax=Pyrus ussuriensis x Pyrus communis TaxID=2448454 RepID=A0A5N5H6Q9_9ROSA|nr:hypothetical protein D8674_039665 [Pyrus ussuriensis x Pyrus communis]
MIYVDEIIEMVAQGVQLATKEEESYKGRVNLSQASHVLGVMVMWKNMRKGGEVRGGRDQDRAAKCLVMLFSSPDSVYKEMLGVIGEHVHVQYEETKSSDDDDTYYEHSYNAMATKRTTRGFKANTATEFLPVLLKTVKGEGEPFSTSWLVDVEKVYMPLNLGHHWVAVEMNLIARRIMVYDSLMSKTNTHKATTKLAPLTSMLPDNGPWPIIASPKSPQQGDCGIFNFKVIELLSCGLPLDRITAANVPEYRLRMVIDMLHGLHNV